MDLTKLPLVFVVKVIWSETGGHLYGHRAKQWFFINDFKDVSHIYRFFQGAVKTEPNCYDIAIYQDGYNLKDHFVKFVWNPEKDKWDMSECIADVWVWVYDFFNCENFNKYFRGISKEKENFYNILIKRIK